jgi:hypothetical protein
MRQIRISITQVSSVMLRWNGGVKGWTVERLDTIYLILSFSIC